MICATGVSFSPIDMFWQTVDLAEAEQPEQLHYALDEIDRYVVCKLRLSPRNHSNFQPIQMPVLPDVLWGQIWLDPTIAPDVDRGKEPCMAGRCARGVGFCNVTR